MHMVANILENQYYMLLSSFNTHDMVEEKNKHQNFITRKEKYIKTCVWRKYCNDILLTKFLQFYKHLAFLCP